MRRPEPHLFPLHHHRPALCGPEIRHDGDGKLATVTGASQWITGAEARAHVHTLRGRYRAILAGIGTVLADDPLLSCRAEGGRNPVRVICDSRLRIPPDCRICRTARRQETIVACAENDPEKRARLEGLGITVLCLPDGQGRVDLAALAAALGQRGIDSILVEGGSEIHAAALAAGIVRRIYAYVGARVFGGRGAKSPLGGPGPPPWRMAPAGPGGHGTLWRRSFTDL